VHLITALFLFSVTGDTFCLMHIIITGPAV